MLLSLLGCLRLHKIARFSFLRLQNYYILTNSSISLHNLLLYLDVHKPLGILTKQKLKKWLVTNRVTSCHRTHLLAFYHMNSSCSTISLPVHNTPTRLSISPFYRTVIKQNSLLATSIFYHFAKPSLFNTPAHELPSHDLAQGFHHEQSTAQLLTGTHHAVSLPSFFSPCSSFSKRKLAGVYYVLANRNMILFSSKFIGNYANLTELTDVLKYLKYIYINRPSIKRSLTKKTVSSDSIQFK